MEEGGRRESEDMTLEGQRDALGDLNPLLLALKMEEGAVG